MQTIETTAEFVKQAYLKMDERLAAVRKRLGRPLTLAEKIVFGHLDDAENEELNAGKSYIMLRPDRIAMQDATAQMALLQFMSAGKKSVAVPTTVHCDHLIRAHVGAQEDTLAAIDENQEVYEFLQSASQKYSIGFWKPGSGIIHQVVLENYAFPGGMMLGTDSHTPNAGGLGMCAVGVGGADAVDVMAGLPWEVLQPQVLGVRLTGAPSGWTAPKDVILKLLGILTVKGGTNRIIEYFGPGAASISCTGKGTITNMGAELGATTSVFPFDDRMDAYLRATARADLADLARAHAHLLTADPEVEQAPEKYFERVIEIDLSTLEPQVVGPHTPDLARPVSALEAEAAEKDYPTNLTAALIGSCTNSSYEDLTRAAEVANQARARGMKAAVPFMVTPGSEQIYATIQRDGQLASFAEIGGSVLANACGPCIGQWQRDDYKKGTRNSIITSFNRNFPGRNDGNPQTLAFIGSPEIVVAYALSGDLSFNPMEDELEAPDGTKWKLDAPGDAPDVPERGFIREAKGYVAPAGDPDAVNVIIAEDSERLERLEPFAPWDGNDFDQLRLLLKAQGKCTTDHISPAGPWLRYRGHLDRISDNAFIGAVNAYTGKAGETKNALDGTYGQTPQVARAYKNASERWVVVGDENYGEGSSREHAAMTPRFLGAAAIIVRSFARIHESNLKKQGVLPLTFEDPADYDKVREDDRISVLGLADLRPGSTVTAVLHHTGGTEDRVSLRHTLNEEQIGWFRAGSALNLLREQEA